MPAEATRLEITPPVARLRLAADERLNSYDVAMIAELERRLTDVEAEPEVSILVITGSERAFSSGADLDAVLPLLEAENSFRFHDEWLIPVHRVADRLAASRLIVIGVLRGWTLAGGLEIALACDLLVAEEGARIGDQHINFALIPGGGASQRLARMVGLQKARELIYTGRVLSGAEAADCGLVLRAFPEAELEPGVEALLASISKRNPRALSHAKMLLNGPLADELAPGLRLERAIAALHMNSPDARDGLRVFVERHNKK